MATDAAVLGHVWPRVQNDDNTDTKRTGRQVKASLGRLTITYGSVEMEEPQTPHRIAELAGIFEDDPWWDEVMSDFLSRA